MIDLSSKISPAALRRLGGSNLEYDSEKLEELMRITPTSQEEVVRRHISLRLPWREAIAGAEAISAAVPVEPQNPAVKGETVRRTERRATSAVRPNRYNASLFPDSLADVSIDVISADLARHGQRVPIEITPEGEVVDGERRWRGACRLGWSSIEVVVGPALSDEEMLDRVVDCCTSARQMSVREQVNVYAAVRAQLQRDAGRQQGRPQKRSPEGNVFSAQEVRTAAATRAGFSSTAIALRAEAVFTRGSPEVQRRVLDGSLSVSAAYEQLPKRPRRSEAESDLSAEQDVAEAAAHEAAEARSIVASLAAQEGAEDLPVAAFDPAPVAPAQEKARALSDINLAERSTSTVALEHEEQPDARLDGHVGAVCEHLRHLVGRNASAAVAFFERVVGEMEGALGVLDKENGSPHFKRSTS